MEGLPSALRELRSEDFNYLLPDESIARFPLEHRDASRLLVWKNNQIYHRHFHEIPGELPADSLLILNDTKVLPARLHFQRISGAWIELLILEHKPGEEQGSMVCQAMIGNKKKWREDEKLILEKQTEDEVLRLEAFWADRENDQIILRWEPATRLFPEILAMWGEMPIPPYLNRPSEKSDLIDYQTVYARHPGAVAAPTAGLHFTETVLKNLEEKGIQTSRLTLHVGLGTFKPMKADKVSEHEMHPEEVIIRRELIQKLASHDGPLIAVGTTSVRSLESLYWLALHCLETGQFPDILESAEPYQWAGKAKPYKAVFQGLSDWMKKQDLDSISFQTRLYLMPGYRFRVVSGMITNFHQPGSTLVVLIASFLGENWKVVYAEALEKGYRFLSYGDSSLLLGPRPD